MRTPRQAELESCIYHAIDRYCALCGGRAVEAQLILDALEHVREEICHVLATGTPPDDRRVLQ